MVSPIPLAGNCCSERWYAKRACSSFPGKFCEIPMTSQAISLVCQVIFRPLSFRTKICSLCKYWSASWLFSLWWHKKNKNSWKTSSDINKNFLCFDFISRKLKNYSMKSNLDVFIYFHGQSFAHHIFSISFYVSKIFLVENIVLVRHFSCFLQNF